MKVYAYGVLNLNPPEHVILPWKSKPEYTKVFEPVFMHYWIDEHLQYHQEKRPTASWPDLVFVESRTVRVELRGPEDYTIYSGEAL